jgi:hypothetical protein
MDRPSLREVIRRKIDDGSLPTKRPETMHVGHGSNGPCDACGDLIHPDQVEYQLTYLQTLTFRLHLACAGLWEAIRSGAGRSPAL